MMLRCARYNVAGGRWCNLADGVAGPGGEILNAIRRGVVNASTLELVFRPFWKIALQKK